MSDFVHVLEQVLGASRRRRRIPRPLLKLLGVVLRPIKPDLARQAQAAVAMDVLDMTFDAGEIRRRFPDLPETPLRQAVEDHWRAAAPPDRRSGGAPVASPSTAPFRAR